MCQFTSLLIEHFDYPQVHFIPLQIKPLNSSLLMFSCFPHLVEKTTGVLCGDIPPGVTFILLNILWDNVLA